MILYNECNEWKRINSRLIQNMEGTEWRTSTGTKRVVQQLTIYGKNNKKINVNDVRLPICISAQGRLAKEYRISKVNQYAYKRIIRNKKVYYEIMTCREKGCIGKIKYNEYEEMQCNKCGIILEDINLRMIEKNDAVIPSSWNNTDLNFIADISMEAKEHNDRIKRIIEWEKTRVR